MTRAQELDVGFSDAGAAFGVGDVVIEVEVGGAAALDALAAVAFEDGLLDV